MNVPLIKISSLTKLKFTMFRSASLLLNAYSHSALLKETIVPRTRTFQDSVFNYLYDSKYCTEVLFRLSREIDFDKMEKILTKYTKHSESPSKIADQLDEESLHQLPAFVFHMKTSDPRKNRRIAATDALCADLLNITVQNQGKIVSLDLLHSWLICLHPDIHRISELQCYGKLIKRRCRELLTGPLDEQSFCPIPLVYLTFVAGLGKRNTGDSHEVLNQLAMFTESNPEITYEKCNSLELAAMCESFFKGGMKLDSKRFLSHISSTLCLLLSPKKVASSCRSEFNPYVVVSLLKVIRQVNYVEGKVLQLLSDFVMNPENEEEVRNIGFLTNVVSAFVGPGRKSQLSSARLKDESIVSSSAKKTSKTSLLNRVEHLVVDIIGENERLRSDKILSLLSSPKNIAQEKPVESEATLKRVRLKDVSRWLWAASSLGYEISPETYQRDLKDRFYSGELTRRTADAVDALLALAIMGHYLDDFIVMKILRSPEFRSALRVRCSQRHRWRFGLFLMGLEIERTNVWGKFSTRELSDLMNVAGTPLGKTVGWISAKVPDKIRRDKKALMSMPEMKDHTTHSELLNQCMDALKRTFDVSEGEDNNNSLHGNHSHKNTMGALKSRPDYKMMEGSAATISNALGRSLANSANDDPNISKLLKVRVLHGYAVRYLHIPGIKVVSPMTGEEIYVEVLHEDAISPGLHEFKVRLLRRMGHSVVTISCDEIQQSKNLENHLKASFGILNSSK